MQKSKYGSFRVIIDGQEVKRSIDSLNLLDKKSIAHMSLTIAGQTIRYKCLGWLIRRAKEYERWLAATFVITIETAPVYENEYMKFYSGNGRVEITEEGGALLKDDGEEGLYDLFDEFHLGEWSYCDDLSFYGHMTKTQALVTLDYAVDDDDDCGHTVDIWFFNDYQIVLLSEYLIRHGYVQLISGE